MTKIIFSVPGQPVGQGRPRFARRGRFVATYDPPKSRNYKALVTMCCQRAYSGEPIAGPVRVTVHAYFEIPASYSKKRTAACQEGRELPTKKADIDNIIKGIFDAMNGIAYTDDKNIIEVKAFKEYSHDLPRVKVTIEEIETAN